MRKNNKWETLKVKRVPGNGGIHNVATSYLVTQHQGQDALERQGESGTEPTRTKAKCVI